MSHMQPHVASCRLTLSHAVSCSLMRPRAVNDEDTLTGALEGRLSLLQYHRVLIVILAGVCCPVPYIVPVPSMPIWQHSQERTAYQHFLRR